MDKFGVKAADESQVAVLIKEPKAIITVEETYSADVCAIICLENEKAMAWRYGKELCECLEIKEPFCPREVAFLKSMNGTKIR